MARDNLLTFSQIDTLSDTLVVKKDTCSIWPRRCVRGPNNPAPTQTGEKESLPYTGEVEPVAGSG